MTDNLLYYKPIDSLYLILKFVWMENDDGNKFAVMLKIADNRLYFLLYIQTLSGKHIICKMDS
jgi:hypothetical protein